MFGWTARGWTSVRIAGESMLPGYRPGDWWLVRRTRTISPGDVVAAYHPLRTDLVIVKRAERRAASGWWLLGDNPAASDDSRTFGAVADTAIIGRLVLRYRRVR